MKARSKQEIQDEIEILRGIALGLYKQLHKTPETFQSKEAMDNFTKYIMEKL
jgi:hypothetical protein